MSEQPSFYGAPRSAGPRDRRIAALIVTLAAVFLAVVIAKPWGAESGPTPSSSSGARTRQPGSPAVPGTPRAAITADLAPASTEAFTTPGSPSDTAAWTGIRWRRVAPDDPLGLVGSVLHWRGGYIATGSVVSGGEGTTPVWTSRDGAHWQPLPMGSATTFRPGTDIVGLAELPSGLVALTELGGTRHESPTGQAKARPLVSWTSSDGQTWSPHGIFHIGRGTGQGGAPRLAAGPAGLVAAATTTATYGATSTDGVHWHALPDATFPAGFVLTDLRGTATGYVAVGQSTTTRTTGTAIALWSVDGRSWATTALPPAAFGSTIGPTSKVTSLALAHDGLMATGGRAAPSGVASWWQSSDGRSWRSVAAYWPFGPSRCAEEGCGGQLGGMLVGDGTRMIALRGGPGAVAWTSSDGLLWSPLSVIGDLPDEGVTMAVLLTGGVLLSDGSESWFGEALTS